MSTNRFAGKARRAKRQKLFAAIALIGPSGSGKTVSALMLAYGMMKAKYPELSDEEIWPKIGVADTEHERSLLYEGLVFNNVRIGQFTFIPFDPPYDVESYAAAQRELKAQGCEVTILDSISHAWESEGGLLELQQSFGGKFQDWMKTNPYYRRFINIVTGVENQIHTISTVRAKQDYQVEQSPVDGRMQVVKLGLRPVMRDSLEYEMALAFSLDMSNVATAVKDNTGGLFKDRPRVLKPEDGEVIARWLDTGEDIYAKIAEQRQSYIDLIRMIEQQAGEKVTKLIQSLENHRSIQRPLEEFTLEWLEKTYKMVKAKADELEAKKGEEEENESGNEEKS